MLIRHIVAATDESDAGRQAVLMALELAARTGARVTAMRVLPFDGNRSSSALEQLQHWVEVDLPPLDPMPPIGYAVAYGMPGIEIGRFAEQAHADLLVLGRKPRSQMLVLGCHRGGPAGVIEAGSTARRVSHTAPCAVLTIPL